MPQVDHIEIAGGSQPLFGAMDNARLYIVARNDDDKSKIEGYVIRYSVDALLELSAAIGTTQSVLFKKIPPSEENERKDIVRHIVFDQDNRAAMDLPFQQSTYTPTLLGFGRANTR
jgi:hypothetical protein